MKFPNIPLTFRSYLARSVNLTIITVLGLKVLEQTNFKIFCIFIGFIFIVYNLSGYQQYIEDRIHYKSIIKLKDDYVRILEKQIEDEKSRNQEK